MQDIVASTKKRYATPGTVVVKPIKASRDASEVQSCWTKPNRRCLDPARVPLGRGSGIHPPRQAEQVFSRAFL